MGRYSTLTGLNKIPRTQIMYVWLLLSFGNLRLLYSYLRHSVTKCIRSASRIIQLPEELDISEGFGFYRDYVIKWLGIKERRKSIKPAIHYLMLQFEPTQGGILSYIISSV